MRGESSNEFILASSVRTEIVTQLSEGAAPTDDLLAGIDSSDSAVYDALSTLADRGVLTEADGVWELTGHGQIVADSVRQWQATESFLGIDPVYWKHHDTSVIPTAFRRRLPEIGEYEVVRSDESQVDRHHQAALSRMRAADSCLVMSPFFSVRYDRAVPDSPETRLLVHPSAVDTKAQRIREGMDDIQPYEEPELRITHCEFSFTVGEGFLVFNLPTNAGEATGDPTKATVVSETESAVEWGRELFESEWAGAEPSHRYAVREHPDVWG